MSTHTVSFGASFVGDYLNVTHSAVHNWAKKTGPDSTDQNAFPYPDVVVLGRSGNLTAFGWHRETLPRLREWLTKKNNWPAEAAAQYWAQVDARLDVPSAPTKRPRLPMPPKEDVVPGQLIFDLEGCDR